MTKPLMTVWCLDQSETDLLGTDQSAASIPETEKTAPSFLSSGRKFNLSDIELEDDFDNEIDNNEVPDFDLDIADIATTLKSEIPAYDEFLVNDAMNEVTDDALFENELTLENEFEQFIEGVSKDRFAEENVFDYDFGQDNLEIPLLSESNPIVTVGLAATQSPLSFRGESLQIVPNRRLSVPQTPSTSFRSSQNTAPDGLSSPITSSSLNNNVQEVIRPPTLLSSTLQRQVPETNSPQSQGLDPRIGLSSVKFLRVRENNYDVFNNIIGPRIPRLGFGDSYSINQDMFQTRF